MLCQFQVYSRVIQLYIYMYIFFFQILFPYRLLQNIEYSSLCYTVGPCWLSILYIVVCICSSQAPNLSRSPLCKVSFGMTWKVLFVGYLPQCLYNKTFVTNQRTYKVSQIYEIRQIRTQLTCSEEKMRCCMEAIQCCACHSRPCLSQQTFG